MKYKSQAFTEWFEGKRLRAYKDICGIWTIGVGHIEGVTRGQEISLIECAELFKADIAHSEIIVTKFATATLTQGQFDAIVDFVFNLGAAAFLKSTLRKKLNLGDIEGAALEFRRWNHAKVNGQVIEVEQLTKRCKGRENLFRGKAWDDGLKL